MFHRRGAAPIKRHTPSRPFLHSHGSAATTGSFNVHLRVYMHRYIKSISTTASRINKWANLACLCSARTTEAHKRMYTCEYARLERKEGRISTEGREISSDDSLCASNLDKNSKERKSTSSCYLLFVKFFYRRISNHYISICIRVRVRVRVFTVFISIKCSDERIMLNGRVYTYCRVFT